MIHGRMAISDDRNLRTLFGLGAAGLLSDAQLLERFASRDGEAAELAFAALVDRHGAMVLRACRGSLRDSHAADDAFQATFLILARRAGSLWVGDSIAPWLLNVACRVSAGARVAEARRKRLDRRAARPESYRESDRDDAIPIIHQEVTRLPEPFRSAVVLCHLQGLTQHEAARRLDWPVGTLQSRLDRGRRRLRRALTRRGLAPSMGIAPMVALPNLLVTSTARAATSVSIGGVVVPSVLALMTTYSRGILMTKLKFGATAAIVGLGVVASAVGIGTGQHSDAADKPSLSSPSPGVLPPTPRQTTVRVKVLIDDAEHVWNNGTGTIIQSNDGETTILTAATLLRPFRSKDVNASNFRHAIWVNAFEHKDRNPTTIYPTADEYPAYPVAFDDEHNLALIRINPGSRMPIAPVVPKDWKPEKGMKLVVAECLVDNNATIHSTTLLRAGFPSEASDAATRFSRLQCDLMPEAEATGGGLFTSDGYLVGVSEFGRPRDKTGIYEGPIAIRRMVERTNNAPTEAPTAPKTQHPEPEPESVSPPEPAVAPKAVDSDGEPDLLIADVPKPWATAARIKVHHNETEVDLGSGTVIHSTDAATLILANSFTLFGRLGKNPPAIYPYPITVDLFDGVLVGKNPATVRCTVKDVIATIVDHDPINDLALIRIAPGHAVPASRMVPPDWTPMKGMKLTSVGCTQGNDASAWTTRVLRDRIIHDRNKIPNSDGSILCEHEAKYGRQGGGLFTADDYLVGVCNASIVVGDTDKLGGLYARPEAIRRLLDRNLLSKVYHRIEPRTDRPSDEQSPPIAPVPAGESPKSLEPAQVPSDQDRRIDELERKLDEVLGALKAIKRPN